MSELVRTGVSLEERTVDRLDALADEWNQRRSNKVTRSEMLREIAPLGITALELTDSYNSGRPMNRREREAWVRQAIHDFSAEETDESDILIDALAKAEDIDRDRLEQCILEAKLDS